MSTKIKELIKRTFSRFSILKTVSVYIPKTFKIIPKKNIMICPEITLEEISFVLICEQ
jgi:hypothetical protein